jgi:hypothetical protein
MIRSYLPATITQANLVSQVSANAESCNYLLQKIMKTDETVLFLKAEVESLQVENDKLRVLISELEGKLAIVTDIIKILVPGDEESA